MNDAEKSVVAGPVHVVPYLCIKGAGEAIEFYKKVFGATEAMARITDGEGRVGHAEIRIGETLLMLADEHPEIEVVSPATYGGSPISLVVYVKDVDATFAQAVAAGAKAVRQPEDRFYGARSGAVVDPYGYRWEIQTKTEELTEEEIHRRAAQQ